MKKGIRKGLLIGAFLLWTVPGLVFALPFNKDMFDTQADRPGEMSRPKPPESVPIGALQLRIESPAAAEAMTNPSNGDSDSITAGHRLYLSNCAPCHGYYQNGERTLGEVGKKITPVQPPDISTDFYAKYSDGKILSAIEFGVRSMPPIGFKLSPQEKWDIISYVRQIQHEAAPGAK
jgi:mono/diheme cytochrome c family protein